MQQEEFLLKMAEILEMEEQEISMEFDFKKDSPQWDSLKGYSIIVMVEEECGTLIEVEEFLNAVTIKDLYEYIEKEI